MDLVLVGKAMLSEPLIQFLADGWGSVVMALMATSFSLFCISKQNHCPIAVDSCVLLGQSPLFFPHSSRGVPQLAP